MKYFFKLRNVIREKGGTNNFTYLLETMTENVIYIYIFLQNLLTNLIFVEP